MSRQKYSARWIKFPFKKTNNRGENIVITKSYSGYKIVYQLNVNNGQFTYATGNFLDALKYGGLSVSDVWYEDGQVKD